MLYLSNTSIYLLKGQILTEIQELEENIDIILSNIEYSKTSRGSREFDTEELEEELSEDEYELQELLDRQ